jgi:methyl-accepting chemotaxis protein
VISSGVRSKLLALAAMPVLSTALVSALVLPTVERVRVGGQIYADIAELNAAVARCALLKSDLNEGWGLLLALASEADPDRRAQLDRARLEVTARIEAGFEAAPARGFDGDLRMAMDSARTTWRELARAAEQELLPLLPAGRAEEARHLLHTAQRGRHARSLEQVGGMVDALNLRIAQLEQDADRFALRRIASAAAIAAALLAAIVVVAVMIGRSISRPLGRLSEAAARVASGDLSAPALAAKGHDEIARLASSFGEMVGVLREVIGEARSVEERLGGAASELVTSNEQLAAGARRQTAQLGGAAASVAEIASAFGRLQSSAEEADRAAHETAAAADRGAATVGRAAAGLGSIEAASRVTAERAAALQAGSDRIGEIVSTLQDFAAETQVLAFNLGIEAARAGEAGAGFTVLAQEVRLLAERSARSSAEIGAIVRDLLGQIRSAREAVDGTLAVATEGRRLSGDVAAAFEAIRVQTSDTSRINSEMAAVVSEQVTAALGVAAGVEEAAHLSSDTRAAAEAILSSAGALREIVRRLDEVMGRFQLPGTGRDVPDRTAS